MPHSKATPKFKVDRVFHALGDPTRRAIVTRLSAGPLSVSRLAAPLAITLTAVVQHLLVLEKSGLVHTEKVGRVRTCRVETGGFSVLEQWIGDQRSIWERRLDRLGDLLAEDDG
jgi:DNA-binding transcriptional ArsR family regulator